MTTRIHTLGFPRMGAHRELKFALEKHWRGEIDANALEAAGAALRASHWQAQRAAGLDYVTVGDFAFYDHVANHIQWLGCEPARFGFSGQEPELARYFTMARGLADSAASAGTESFALEMTKWFDSNYHYLVPEFDAATRFSLQAERLFSELAQAQALGYPVKVVLLGPLSFLWLGKEKCTGLDRLTLLDALLPVYAQLLERLKTQGVWWVQVDEPILGLDLPPAWREAFAPAYRQLAPLAPPLLLATYFSPLGENLSLACALPTAGLHVDAVRAPEELAVLARELPADKLLSVGIIDGRNIWRADPDELLARLKPALATPRRELWLAPSCSLLHVPYSLRDETQLDPEIRSWLAFALEKLDELRVLRAVVDGEESAVEAELLEARAALASRRTSRRVHRPAVAQRLAARKPGDDQRASQFAQRQVLQRERLRLPPLPTTTIGSFPQTVAIRATRAAFKRGEIDIEAYEQRMREEIGLAVREQQALGLDVLVHGEAERNDMVEFFGEHLDGFAFTRQGWVQSYGSRCVKPPVLYGDVARPVPMTVGWTRFAQSLCEQPMKGMLTGPVTMLQWSFVRDDLPRSVVTEQLAWAIRDEVLDLEQAGVAIIQIDEPALREGLPLRRAAWPEYLLAATRAFRIAASGVRDDTQIHTHMCYAEFNDILPEIAAMDADVITIETSRSDMELLRGFGDFHYPNEIGPGVYDIHSPRVPSKEQILRLMRKAMAVLPADKLWINPDCGLKTRGWPETRAALAQMVAAAQQLREELATQPPA